MSASSNDSNSYPRLGLYLALVVVLAAVSISDVPAPVKIIDDGGGGGGGVACTTPTIGCWKQLPTPGVSSVNMIALKTGKVLITERSFGDLNQKYQIFDPGSDTFGSVMISPVVHNLYCTGFDQLPDGRILFAGSVRNDHNRKATIYDPATDGWAGQPDMRAGRFYPTVITLSHSELLALDGDDFTGLTTPNIPELFNTSLLRWRQLFGAEYGSALPPPNAFELPTYPRTHVLSTGSVIYTGSRQSDPGGGNSTRILDPVFQTWTAPLGVDPITGTSGLMYERDTIMKAGPSLVFTLSATTPGAQWRQRASMNQARNDFFVPALPDGKILAIGGVTTPEIYDPASNTWTNMAPASQARGDHSGTVLLSDGRILTAGPTFTAEVYSPPYLFTSSGDLATRPVITGVIGGGGSGVIRYGEVFRLTSPVAARVDAIRLIRLGAATHSWDMGQRSVALSFASTCCDPALEPGVNNNTSCIEGHTCCAEGSWTCNAATGATTCTTVCGTLGVFAPQHSFQAPPGFYYVFIVVDGVPSKAAIVKLE